MVISLRVSVYCYAIPGIDTDTVKKLGFVNAFCHTILFRFAGKIFKVLYLFFLTVSAAGLGTQLKK